MKRRLIYLASALVLVGCANHPEWTKEGVAPEAAARELSDCQSIARDATARDTNIITDILATRGHDWQNTCVMGTHVQFFQNEDRNRSGDIIDRCMISKGFVPGG
jgi:hypothetical protein